MNTDDIRSRAYFWSSDIAKKKITNRSIAGTASASCIWSIGFLITENIYFIAPAVACAFYAWLQFERKGFIEILEAGSQSKITEPLQHNASNESASKLKSPARRADQER